MMTVDIKDEVVLITEETGIETIIVTVTLENAIIVTSKAIFGKIVERN